ncbi:MAG: sugar phosphate isomerase/epimerase [Fimbriimonadaceae bacterium]|nr:sugar phosphate isomerase/epimerase [Fimbriimonadaceae bacterium]
MAPIALTLYTLRDSLATPDDCRASLPRVRAIGYEFVQVSGVRGLPPDELRTALDDAGLTCIATHCQYAELRDEPSKVADAMVALGCAHTALAYVPRELQNKEGFERTGDLLGERAAAMRAQGLTLSYHNHAFEFERFAGQTGWEIMVERAPDLAIEFDVYWLAHAGCDPADWIRRCDRAQPLLHLKDRAVYADEPDYAEVGYGNLNWDAILAAAEERSVEWWIVEQDTCRRDPFDSVRLSFDWLAGRRG